MPPEDQNLTAATTETVVALQYCFAGAVLTVNRQGSIAACSPAAEGLLGLKPGRRSVPVFLRKIVQGCFKTVTPTLNQTVSATLKRSRRLLSVSAMPVRRSRMTEVMVVVHDLAPLHHIEKNLHRLDRLASLGTLSASMAHEIKNALVAVKTFTELLLDSNRDAELAGTVQRELQRIESIVRQMLRFATPARPAFSPVRVHDVLEHSLRMVQRQIEGKLISLNRSFRATPDYINGDDHQLEQAFVNLLLNAVEAMGPNGSLHVTTEFIASPASPKAINSPHVRVTISDTGVGVTPENMIHLFEPFFTTKHDGTGLGLPITQRIVKEHHGDISVHSEPNKGTTFNILLPANTKPR